MDHIVIDDSSLKSDLINTRGQKYPHILISKDNIVKPSIAPERYSEDIFLENDKSFWKRVFHQYRYKGFYSMLNFVKLFCDDTKQSTDSFNGAVRILYWFASILLFLHAVYLRIYFHFYPFDKLSDEELLNEFSPNLNWMNGQIRAFEWHPTVLRCAMALVNDLVYVYSADEKRPLNHICCLKNLAQKRISSMAWHPKRDDILAIASERKILLWFLQSDLQHFKPDVQKCLQVVDAKLPSPIISIVFDVEGNKLIACSPRSSSLSIITFDWTSFQQPGKLNYTVRLVRVPFTSQFTSLQWSPDKSRLLARTTSNTIRIFESLQWSSKCWKSNLTAQCQTTCWSQPSGRILLFSPKQSSKVYALTFYDKAESGDVGGSPDNSVLILDSAEPHFNDTELGVHIQQIVWDRNSTRLAISFQDKPEVIALFATRLTSSLQLWPLGTIRSDFADGSNSIPLLMKYHNCFLNSGSLLSICWSNGAVSHVSLPADDSSISAKQMSDIISSPRSLTTLCTSPFRTASTANTNTPMTSPVNSPSSFIRSPVNGHTPASSSVTTKAKAPMSSMLRTIPTPKRTPLFSTRVKFD